MYYFNGLRKFSREYIQSAYLVEPKGCGLELQVPFLYKHIWIELQGHKRVWYFTIYFMERSKRKILGVSKFRAKRSKTSSRLSRFTCKVNILWKNRMKCRFR